MAGSAVNHNVSTLSSEDHNMPNRGIHVNSDVALKQMQTNLMSSTELHFAKQILSAGEWQKEVHHSRAQPYSLAQPYSNGG